MSIRVGYYKLTREKEKSDDWIWIVDHTIQWGKEKCLAILGIRQSTLPKAETILRFEDVEPLALFPVTRSNGQVVYQQLEETVSKTGVPRQIISDHGTDVKSGIERFCSNYPTTCFIYDIKHKVAAVLKRELGTDNSVNSVPINDGARLSNGRPKPGKRFNRRHLRLLRPRIKEQRPGI